MRILHVIDSINLRQGGPSVSVPALAEAQVKLGHVVTIVCRDYRHLGSMNHAEGVKIISVSGGRWNMRAGCFSPRFQRVVGEQSESSDIIHSHGLWTAAGYYARKALVAVKERRQSIHLVVSPRGMLTPWALQRSYWRKWVAWRLFERGNLEIVDLFHATSHEEAGQLQEAITKKLKFRSKSPGTINSVVVPNGVRVSNHLPERTVLEAKHPMLKKKKWILFMSRIHPKKGLLELAKAWVGMRSDYPEWELAIAGGEDDPDYARVVRNELKGAGVWLGEVQHEDKWSALGNAGFLALPSYSENFGIVVAESLAMSRPVLTTTETPWGAAKSPIKTRIRIKENMSNESMNLEKKGCGVICEPGMAGVRMGLDKMLKMSEAKRDEMGKKGREWMQEDFSWEEAASRVINAYEQLV